MIRQFVEGYFALKITEKKDLIISDFNLWIKEYPKFRVSLPLTMPVLFQTKNLPSSLSEWGPDWFCFSTFSSPFLVNTSLHFFYQN